MQTADPEVLALCESWDMHCRRRLRKPRRRHRHRWHRCKAVTETHPLAYPKWVIPAICTLYYIFILQISYTVNMFLYCKHDNMIYTYTYTFFHSTRSVAMSCRHASRSKAVLADHGKESCTKTCTVKLSVKVTGHDSATCGVHIGVPEASKRRQCSLKLWRFRHIVKP